MRGSAASARVVALELALDRRVVGDRVGAVERRQVEHVDEQPRALDVREELVAEPRAVARALDQPGDVGDDELALGALERPEHRLERREGVVGDLRRRAREPRQQRGLAGVGQADEADVGEQLQRQLEPALLARQPALGEAGRLARRVANRLLPRPPEPPRATMRAGRRDKVVQRAVVGRAPASRAGRATTSVSPSAPWRMRGAAVAAGVGAERVRAPERLRSRSEPSQAIDDVAAVPAVAAVGPAARHVRLAAEARRAVAAAPGLDVDAGPVVQHRWTDSSGSETAPSVRGEPRRVRRRRRR